MMAPDIFRLTQAERDSAVWRRLKTQLEAMLQHRREANDDVLDDEATARLRGEIAVLKELLDLDVTRVA